MEPPGRLLLGEELSGIAIPVARVAGIALIALGVACWPGPPLVGMLIYSGVVTLYLACVGFAGGLTGILLWPAVVLHLILTALLLRASTLKTLPSGLNHVAFAEVIAPAKQLSVQVQNFDYNRNN